MRQTHSDPQVRRSAAPRTRTYATPALLLALVSLSMLASGCGSHQPNANATASTSREQPSDLQRRARAALARNRRLEQQHARLAHERLRAHRPASFTPDSTPATRQTPPEPMVELRPPNLRPGPSCIDVRRFSDGAGTIVVQNCFIK